MTSKIRFKSQDIDYIDYLSVSGGMLQHIPSSKNVYRELTE